MKSKNLFKSIAFFAIVIITALGMLACKKPGVDRSQEYVEAVLESISFPATTSTNLTLPTVDEELYPGVVLSFSSDKPASLSNEGVITRSPTVDVKVNFTATATCGEYSDSTNFEITVLKRDFSALEKLELARDSLALGDTSAVTANSLTLPSEDSEGLGITITWVSNNTSAVTNEGLIIRPSYKEPDANAKLTATLTLGTESVTKEFDITVKAKGLDTVNPSYDNLDIEFTAIAGNPHLIICGNAYLDAEFAITRTIALIIHSGEETKTIANDATLVSATDGEFKFTVNLAEQDLEPEEWYDLRIKVTETHEATTYGDDKYIDLKAVDVTGFENLFIKKGQSEIFRFDEYNGDLKLVREIMPFNMSLNTDENVKIVLENNKLYLSIEGSAYFSDDITLDRVFTLTVSKDSTTYFTRTSENFDAEDSTKFKFYIELKDLNAGYGAWLDITFKLEETNEIGAVSTEQASLNVNSVSIGEGHAVRNAGVYAYFESQNGLKLVVRETEIQASYLNSATVLKLEQGTDADAGKVFLLLEGTIWQKPFRETNRTIVLKLSKDSTIHTFANTLSGTDVSQDGKYRFYADVTGLFVGEGAVRLDILVTEFGVERAWEVKQAAHDYTGGENVFVPKPTSGLVVLTACGIMHDSIGNGYNLAVDQYNNIRLVVKSFTISTNTNDNIYVEVVENVPYLVVKGSAYYDESTTLLRTITISIGEGDLTNVITIPNQSTDPDTRKYEFKVDLSVVNEKYGSWLVIKINLNEEGKISTSKLSIDDVTNFNEGNLVRGGGKYIYLVEHSGYVSVVVRQTDVEASYLSSDTLIKLEKGTDGDVGNVFLVMSGTIWQTPRVATVADRDIDLVINGVHFNNTLTGNYVSQDGKYLFRADVTNTFTNLGIMQMDIYVTEFGAERAWEVKQAAWDDEDGAIVEKPDSGIAILTACGEHEVNGTTYYLAVDKWNNIKFVASSLHLSANTNDTAKIVTESNNHYLYLSGAAYMEDDDALNREITLTISHSKMAEQDVIVATNQSVSSNTKEYLFKVDLLEIPGYIYGEWLDLQLTITEGSVSATTDLEAGSVTCDDEHRYYNANVAFQNGSGALKIVLVATGDIVDNYITDTNNLKLYESGGKVYFELIGVAHFKDSLIETERTIKLKINNTCFDNTLSGDDVNKDGKYHFVVDVTGMFVNQSHSMYIAVTEYNVERTWEVKQAAHDAAGGAFVVSKPSEGITTDTSLVKSYNFLNYKFVIDAWNNIKISVESNYVMSLTKTTASVRPITVVQDGNVYLTIQGTAFANSGALSRTFTFVIYGGNGINLSYTVQEAGARGDDEFCFKIDITSFAKSSSWYEFKLEMEEDGILYSQQFLADEAYCISTEDNFNWINSIHTGGTEYMVACNWGKVFMEIKNSTES